MFLEAKAGKLLQISNFDMESITNFTVSIYSNETSNVTVQKPSSLMFVEPSTVTTWAISLLVLCYAGSLFNFLLAFTIFLRKNLRSGAGCLISASLTVMGLLCSVSFPLSAIFIYGSQIRKWNVSPSACIVDRFLFQTLLHILDWLDAMIAINRFIAVLLPHRYVFFTTTKSNAFQIAASVIIGAVLALPGCFGLAGGYVKNGLGGCSYPASGWIGDIQQSLGVFIPIAVSVVVYFSLSLVLQLKRRGHDGQVVQNSKNRAATAVTKMSFMIFFVNTLCYLPVPVLLGVAPKTYFNSVPLQLASRVCYPIGFLVIPILLLGMSKEYRSALGRLVGHDWNGASVHPSTVGSSAAKRVANASVKSGSAFLN